MFQEKLGEMFSRMVISYTKHKYFVVKWSPVKTGKSQDHLAFITNMYRVHFSNLTDDSCKYSKLMLNV